MFFVLRVYFWKREYALAFTSLFLFPHQFLLVLRVSLQLKNQIVIVFSKLTLPNTCKRNALSADSCRTLLLPLTSIDFQTENSQSAKRDKLQRSDTGVSRQSQLRTPPETPPTSHSTIVSRDLKRLLNWVLIIPRDSSLSRYTEKTMFPFHFKLNGIWSWWPFSFRFWTKWNSI